MNVLFNRAEKFIVVMEKLSFLGVEHKITAFTYMAFFMTSITILMSSNFLAIYCSCALVMGTMNGSITYVGLSCCT